MLPMSPCPTQGTTGLGTAQDILNGELAELTTILGGAVGKELDSYYEKQKNAGAAIAETRDRILELNGLKHLTPAQKEELETLNGKYGDLKQAYDDNATAHEAATARIIYDLISQKVLADGVQDGDIQFLADMGVAYGVYDEKTAAAMKSVDKAITEHGTNAQAVLSAVGGAINALPNSKTFTYNIQVNGQVPYGAEPGGAAPVNNVTSNNSTQNTTIYYPPGVGVNGNTQNAVAGAQ